MRSRRRLLRLRLPQEGEVAAAPQRIKIGGSVQQAKLVRQPQPVYPPLAKQARIRAW